MIDILDELKKEQREARDAIRWLENQFRAGNRYGQSTENFPFISCLDLFALKLYMNDYRIRIRRRRRRRIKTKIFFVFKIFSIALSISPNKAILRNKQQAIPCQLLTYLSRDH